MSEEKRRQELLIKRILVALDASPHSLTALETAAQLARHFRAELLGLFVEDARLLRLTRTPHATEISFVSGIRRRMNAQEVEWQLRAQAMRIREVFEGVAQRKHVRWSFRVQRGRIESEVVSAASEADLLVLGKTGLSIIRRRRLGSTARAVLSKPPTLTLLLHHGAHLGIPALVIYDGTSAAKKGLQAGTAMVDRLAPLTVVIVADEEEAAKALRSEVREWARGTDLKIQCRRLIGASTTDLVNLVMKEEKGLVVLPASLSLLKDEKLLTLLRELEVPALLVT